jgi:class 3 adenylate cyclase
MAFIVESKIFVTLTMFLTIWALIGEDIKLMTTSKDLDDTFMIITFVMMGIFTAEIVMASLAKDDYYLSFFFWLDIISTLSLILDIPAVSEYIMGSDEELRDVRGSKTARLGARIGRIVRVLRLVRILKLYKTVFEQAQEKRRRKRLAKKRKPGEDDEWAEMELTQQERRESRVGMRLSELTIRRVIFLVLFMMLVLPLLKVNPADQFATSAQYGADLVYSTFNKLELAAGTEAEPSARVAYEKAMLKYVYYHSWYTRRPSACLYLQDCSLDDFTSSMFWFGIAASQSGVLQDKIALAQLNSSYIESWDADQTQLLQTEDDVSWSDSHFMPREQRLKMGSWSTDCPYEDVYKRLGVSFLDEGVANFPSWTERAYPSWTGKQTVDQVVRCPENLRQIERKKVSPQLNVTKAKHETWHFAFYFDLRPFVFEEALYSLLITAFVLLSLLISAFTFAADANVLVLHPVENMMQKVETIRSNPLMATKVADEELKREQIAKARKSRDGKGIKETVKEQMSEKMCCMGKQGSSELMETVILEKTIIKLGSLLALGFGEAGSRIIESNLVGGHTASVNGMVEGTRVDCILGNVRIQEFFFAIEVLQGKVMTFVNQIAEIVHGVVTEFHGAANKNNGDTYLVVWTILPDSEDEVKQRMADMSVVALARILAAVHRSPLLATYREHPGLLQRMGTSCRVNVTSGLHFGWAIEGAVGSEFKIDASYLSPNVSIAESIERATKIYDVSILLSESVMRMCTPGVAATLRLIDRVVIAGSRDPFNLYVIDFDVRSLTVEPPSKQQWNWNSRTRFRVRQHLEMEKNLKFREEFDLLEVLLRDPDIATMRFRYTLEFTQIFNMGYQNYSQGEWATAQRFLNRTHSMLGVKDGPSEALLSFMGGRETAPEKWAGVRELSEAELA